MLPLQRPAVFASPATSVFASPAITVCVSPSRPPPRPAGALALMTTTTMMMTMMRMVILAKCVWGGGHGFKYCVQGGPTRVVAGLCWQLGTSKKWLDGCGGVYVPRQGRKGGQGDQQDRYLHPP